jgi:hypothetical protein
MFGSERGLSNWMPLCTDPGRIKKLSDLGDSISHVGGRKLNIMFWKLFFECFRDGSWPFTVAPCI